MMTKEELDAIPMVFIVGKGRSGTTLLQTLLDANPECVLPLESRFVIHLKSKYEKISQWDEELIREFYLDLFGDLKFSTLWKVDKSKLLSELMFLGNQADFASLCKIVYLNHLSVYPKTRIRLIGDKNPIYTVFIPELLEIFPNSKFIHLVRDHRDNIHSHMKVFPIKNVSFLAGKWVFFNERVEKFKQVKPEDVLTVRYEDLVADPEKYLSKICSFLDLIFNPEMLRFHEKVETGFKDLEVLAKKIHPNLYNPINKTKVQEWKRGMLPSHVRTADNIAGKKALEYGYHPENKIRSTFYLKTFTRSKVLVWLGFIKMYYNMPLIVRESASSFFKILFGKDYKRKQELFVSENDEKRK